MKKDHHLPGARPWDLLSAVKLFSKYSNLCDHGTWTLRTNRQR